MEKLKDYYALLGITPRATREEMHAAYRRKLKTYHPDLNKDPFAVKIYMDILQAYNTLSTPHKRKIYDMQRRTFVETQEPSATPNTSTASGTSAARQQPSSNSGTAWQQDPLYAPTRSTYTARPKPRRPVEKKSLLQRIFSFFFREKTPPTRSRR